MVSSVSLAQNRKVTGNVTSEDGVLIGVTILEEGTTNGTVTDVDGNFSFILRNDDAVILVSYLGFVQQRIPYQGQTNLDIFMEVDNAQLEEIVVIGYGTAKKKEITSSITTIEAEDLNRMTVGNVAESMQGLAPGVQVFNGGGGPGSAPNIVIRGITTNQGSDPLIVVDGVPLPEGTSLNFLNPADIEDLQILKDGSATSIYGTRASNGVILVSTKRGVGGKATITGTASYGIKTLEKPAMAGATEYARVKNARQNADGSPDFIDPSTVSTDTDWWEEVYNDVASVQNYAVQISGGGENLNYMSSLSYFRDQSHLDRGYWERLTGRFNLDFNVSDKVFIRQDFNPRYEHWENTPNVFWNTLSIAPLTEVFLPFDEREGRNEFSIYERSVNQVPNPVATVARSFDESFFFSMFSNTQLTVDITDNLSVSSRFGVTFDQTRRDIFRPEFLIFPVNEENQISDVESRITNRFDYVWNNLIQYDRVFGKHDIGLTLGYVLERNQRNFVEGFNNNIPLTGENFRFLDAAEGDSDQAFGNEFANTLESFLARVRYNYDDRFFFFASLRNDGSSRFPGNNRRANFYSFSGAWDISSEAFFNIGFLDRLKLKAGFGQVGNQNIPESAFVTLVDNGDFILGENKDLVITNFVSQLPNQSLQWETVEDINLGIEGSILGNAVTFSVERYRRTSKDLLFETSLPLFTGAPSLVWQNVGSFESNGWDIALGFNKQIRDFTLSANATITTNESKVVELAPGNDQLFGQQRAELGNGFLKITELGQTVGLFYGYETDGIFRNQTEINSHSTNDGTLIQPNAQPGDLRFVDQNEDGRIDEEDFTTIGNPFPDFVAGLNLNLGYKRWDMNMQWYGSFGNDVYNYTKTFLTSGQSNRNVQEGLINEVWTESNPNATIPRLTTIDPNRNFGRSSDFFVEDGTFMRLKNIQLGYNFEVPFASQLRVYVSGQNLLTFTEYTGFDPEVDATGPNTGIINGLGIDFGRYPLTRTYLVGLNMTF